jgi:hypothetical protein
LGPTSHDRDHLDLCGPATITITDHSRGEIAFGALQAGLDIAYSRSSVGITWEGFDEMDEVSGDGSAELNDDGSIEIEFATTMTRPSSKRNGRLLQQPARPGRSCWNINHIPASIFLLRAAKRVERRDCHLF